MQNPMITKCGHSFNYSEITDWVERYNSCPVCGK